MKNNQFSFQSNDANVKNRQILTRRDETKYARVNNRKFASADPLKKKRMYLSPKPI